MAEKTLLINAVNCKRGGGVNDLVHTLPLLRQRLADVDWRILAWVVQPAYDALQDAGVSVEGVSIVAASSPPERFVWERIRFPRLARKIAPNAVFHFSNFILHDLPEPLLTVLRSPVFFSKGFGALIRKGVWPQLHYRTACRYSRKTVERAERVFCISEAQKEDIIDTLGPIGEKVEVSYLGFDIPKDAVELRKLNRAALIERMPEPFRTQLQPVVDPDHKVVLNVAHYYEHKNLGDLLRAFEALSATRGDATLIMTAGLLDYDGAWNDQTREEVALARKLAAKGRYIDLGSVPKDCVWKLLAMANVFSFPSGLESFGHPLLEAAAMGVPTIASDTRVHREVAAGSAMFHPVGDARDLENKLLGVLDGSIDVKPYLDAGQTRAYEFSWEKHVDDLFSAIIAIAR